MKNFLIVAVILLAFCGILGSCSDSSESSYSDYSDTYRNDSEYRKNIKDIADVYGVSEKEVDQKINAVTGGR